VDLKATEREFVTLPSSELEGQQRGQRRREFIAFEPNSKGNGGGRGGESSQR
jgi:hypothetical protein